MRSRIYVAFCLLAAAAAVAAASCSRSRPGHFTHAAYLPHDAKIDIVAFVNEIGQILLSATARHPMPDAHCPPSSPWSIDRWILLFLPSLSSFLSMLDQSISQKMSPAGTSRCIDLIRSSISLWMQYQLAVARAQCQLQFTNRWVAASLGLKQISYSYLAIIQYIHQLPTTS